MVRILAKVLYNPQEERAKLDGRRLISLSRNLKPCKCLSRTFRALETTYHDLPTLPMNS